MRIGFIIRKKVPQFLSAGYFQRTAGDISPNVGTPACGDPGWDFTVSSRLIGRNRIFSRRV